MFADKAENGMNFECHTNCSKTGLEMSQVSSWSHQISSPPPRITLELWWLAAPIPNQINRNQMVEDDMSSRKEWETYCTIQSRAAGFLHIPKWSRSIANQGPISACFPEQESVPHNCGSQQWSPLGCSFSRKGLRQVKNPLGPWLNTDGGRAISAACFLYFCITITTTTWNFFSYKFMPRKSQSEKSSGQEQPCLFHWRLNLDGHQGWTTFISQQSVNKYISGCGAFSGGRAHRGYLSTVMLG